MSTATEAERALDRMVGDFELADVEIDDDHVTDDDLLAKDPAVVVAGFDSRQPRDVEGKWVDTPRVPITNWAKFVADTENAKKGDVVAESIDGDRRIVNGGGGRYEVQRHGGDDDWVVEKHLSAISVEYSGVAGKWVTPSSDSEASAPKAQWTPKSTRSAGSDLLDQDGGKANDLPRPTPSTPSDRTLEAIVSQQSGWNAPAQVVSSKQMDHAVRAGWTPMWRGTNLGSRRQTLSAADDARTGTWRMGRGVFGNGVYTSARKTSAEQYAGRVPDDSDDPDQWGANGEWIGDFIQEQKTRGVVTRMALDPSANVADYHALSRERDAWLTKLAANGQTPSPVWNDIGRYAAMRGYDALKIEDEDDGTLYPGDSPAQYIIFNRSALMIEEA